MIYHVDYSIPLAINHIVIIFTEAERFKTPDNITEFYGRRRSAIDKNLITICG